MHKTIHRTLLLCNLTHQPFNALNLSQITDVAAVTVSLQFLTCAFKLFLVTIKQDDLSTMRGQQAANSLSHATGSASDKYLFTFEVQKIGHFVIFIVYNRHQ